MAYFSLTAKLEWLTLVRPAATAGAHSRSRNAFGEETLTSCLTRVGGPEIRLGSTSIPEVVAPLVLQRLFDVGSQTFQSVERHEDGAFAFQRQFAEALQEFVFFGHRL